MNAFQGLENTKIKFGIHYNKKFKDIPDEYLKFLLTKNIPIDKLLYYCQLKFDLPKTLYNVEVCDSINTDGSYTVEAYNKKEAISICKRKHNIQITQSYSGTTFSVVRVN